MTHGPCGGVRSDGGCEVDGRACPFLVADLVPPPIGLPYEPRPVGFGRVLVDLRLPARADHGDRELSEVARVLRGVGATALVGEHVDDPTDAAPHHHAERLAQVGLPAIVTVTGRERTEVEHAAEIVRLVGNDVVAVHCVTGDHPSVRLGPEATATFTLDGTELAAVARTSGATVSVCESPLATPVADRPARVAAKQAAGADLVVLNHAGPPSTLVDFADRCRDVGVVLALVAPVPVITDHRSAHALAQFPGLVLPDGLVDRVLAAADPHAAGVAAAAEIGAELLASGRFAAVNLSGSATSGGPRARAETMAEVAAALSAA
jgi:5,10-methylenetetrahydrofolate reductase